ncbi:Armadillo-type fold [Artemisia annua]|uniref:Armadillo-type fold n=1 Tax=Artemisia annua TaxID=35608 RepID=A0A2U1M4Q7_ARTAN|nr:Armadillo-type fold [Artemisia annua]
MDIYSMQLSPDGSYHLTNGMDCTLRICDLRPYASHNRCIKIIEGHQHNVEQNLLKCSWSPDGSKGAFPVKAVDTTGVGDSFVVSLLTKIVDDQSVCYSLSDNAYALVADIMKKLVAIAPHHCHLFITELAGSMKKLTTLGIDELRVFGEIEKAMVNTSGSDGAAILRVIQALSSLVASLSQDKEQTILEKEQVATLSLVNDINAALEPLWIELSTCISKIETFTDTTTDASASTMILTSRTSSVLPPLPAGTQNILPYIESFFVMCEKLQFRQDFVPSSEDASTSDNQQKTLSTSVKVDEKNVAFVKFSDKHRKLLNAFIRQNPGLLEKSFSVMLKVPHSIDFDNKRSHFRSKIKHHHDHHHSSLRISVRRAYILEDSYNQLRIRGKKVLMPEDLLGNGISCYQGLFLIRGPFSNALLLFMTLRMFYKQDDIVVKLIDFLLTPHATTSELLAEKDQIKKRKRVPSKSSSKKESAVKPKAKKVATPKKTSSSQKKTLSATKSSASGSKVKEESDTGPKTFSRKKKDVAEEKPAVTPKKSAAKEKSVRALEVSKWTGKSYMQSRKVYSQGATYHRSNEYYSPTVSSIMKKRNNMEQQWPNRSRRPTAVHSSPKWAF